MSSSGIYIIFHYRKNESSLLDLDPLSMVTKKQPPTGSAQPEFDQILDLSNDATSTTTASSPPPMMATPLIAFEDNSITTSPKQEVPTTSGIFWIYFIMFSVKLKSSYFRKSLWCFHEIDFTKKFNCKKVMIFFVSIYFFIQITDLLSWSYGDSTKCDL